jgi:hypothetical protein
LVVVRRAIAPLAQFVTITNIGNQQIELVQPATTNYTIGTLSKTKLSPGETAIFTIQPNREFTTNTYNFQV